MAVCHVLHCDGFLTVPLNNIRVYCHFISDVFTIGFLPSVRTGTISYAPGYPLHKTGAH